MKNMATLLNNQGVNHLQAACMRATMGNSTNMSDNYDDKNVDRAIYCFQQALALILKNTEIHKHQGDFFFYGSDEHGMIQYEDNNVGDQLVNNLNLQDTGVRMSGIDDESFIHWQAAKIGYDDHDNDDSMSTNIDHNNHGEGEYRYLSTSVFHSMICIYNLGLCYQYKGMQTSSRSLLEASVDHYMQAYELATRFRLQHIDQYMLLMVTLNNLATISSFLNAFEHRDVCNSYLLSTLMLLTTSEEGQEESSLVTSTNNKDTLKRRGHRATFQSFFSNVTYLVLQDSAASAA